MPEFLTVFALIAIVLTLSALGSGLVVRAPISFPILFLGLGFLLGKQGLGIISIGPHDPVLEAVATVSLAFVLFLDAVRLRLDELGKEWFIPILVLGPGTLLTIALIAIIAWIFVGATPLQALLFGAVLSSTDPVVLRDVIQDTRIPRSVRQILGIEASTNDVVVLPIVLVLIAVAKGRLGGAADWLTFMVRLVVLGPLVGFVIGAGGAWALGKVDARLGVSRAYQALYGVGLILGAYVAGVAVGGDGFLAAFAAGLATVILNYDLCDCFLEYGEVTAEMAMLLAFILFGAVLSSLLASVPLGPCLVLAALALGVARPLSLGLILWHVTMSRAARAFVGWFGPRGLNSLLLMLLVVQRGIPAGEWLLTVTGVVVIASVVLHGISATPVSAWYGRIVLRETLPEERESSVAGLLSETKNDVSRVSPQELAERLASEHPPRVVDVRTRSAYGTEAMQIPGSIRVLPDRILEWARDQSREQSVVAYCS